MEKNIKRKKRKKYKIKIMFAKLKWKIVTKGKWNTFQRISERFLWIAQNNDENNTTLRTQKTVRLHQNVSHSRAAINSEPFGSKKLTAYLTKKTLPMRDLCENLYQFFAAETSKNSISAHCNSNKFHHSKCIEMKVEHTAWHEHVFSSKYVPVEHSFDSRHRHVQVLASQIFSLLS